MPAVSNGASASLLDPATGGYSDGVTTGGFDPELNVRIIGTQKSNPTKKALRFFKERRIEVHFIDLGRGRTSAGELTRFAERFGVDALVDRRSKAYERSGLEHLRLAERDLLERLLDDPRLLILPLLRSGSTLELGWDEAVWRAWLDERRA